ncbi:hypothetical protein D3C81_1814840 [compost metagenome]
MRRFCTIIRHAALWNRVLLDPRYRSASAPIEHENLSTFSGLDQCWKRAAVTVRNIVERRLRRYVVIPQVMVNGLEMPALATCRNVQRDD